MFGATQHEGFMSEDDFLSLGEQVETSTVLDPVDSFDPDDPAVMFYTSGTTAMPKGCELSHRVFQHSGVIGGERFGLTEGDKMWAPLPMFHTTFTMPFTGIVSVGGTVISMQHFDAR